MRVLLADDHTLVRAGIRGLVEAIPGVEIVAETGDGQQALALILQLQPDVALVDVSMPGLNGLDLAARVAREAPRTRVAILSMHGTPGHVAQALRGGVKGYVLKDAAAEELPLLLNAVMRGETYLSPAISKHVVDAYLDREGNTKAPPPERASLDGLTPRQR
jgi:DNA-binding NarL/FixJ family response regulator